MIRRQMLRWSGATGSYFTYLRVFPTFGFGLVDILCKFGLPVITYSSLALGIASSNATNQSVSAISVVEGNRLRLAKNGFRG